MPGFKTSTRTGIVLAVGQQLHVPFTLEVGGVNEQVTVTAEAPCSTPLRLVGRQLRQAAGRLRCRCSPTCRSCSTRYAPGVNPNDAQNQVSQGFVDGTNAAAGTAIGSVGNNTYTIDGATNNGTARRLATSPNSDMIQEMRVESSNFDARVGHGTGLQISMMTRAGHERASRHGQLPVLDQHAQRAQRAAEGHLRRPREVASYEKGRSHNVALHGWRSGRHPGLFDGRGKLFFFANYSHVDDFIPGRTRARAPFRPTQKHLEGDFSDMLLLPSPAQYQIYDPLTARHRSEQRRTE